MGNESGEKPYKSFASFKDEAKADDFDAEIDNLMIPGEVFRAQARELVEQEEEKFQAIMDRASAVLDECKIKSNEIYESLQFTDKQKHEFSELWLQLLAHFKNLKKDALPDFIKQDHLDSLQENLRGVSRFNVINKLKELGTPATLDTSFEGGIVTIEISRELKRQLKDWETAKGAFMAADNASPAAVRSELQNIPWNPPANITFDVLFIDYEITDFERISNGLYQTNPEEQERLVADMDQAGYRALTFAELVALGIQRPDLNKKRNEWLCSNSILDSEIKTPRLYCDDDGKRRLNAGDYWIEWNKPNRRFRYLFVAK